MKWSTWWLVLSITSSSTALADGDWEITPESEAALARGLDWLARNQGPEGNWESDDLGLVALGALAFLGAGEAPGRGEHGRTLQRALDYILRNAQPSGLLNMADPKRDMYNHGLATFVLSQAHGQVDDPRLVPALDAALRLIVATQCGDGGWDYIARRQPRGHDLSLAVIQAKALRSALDIGLDVPSEVVDSAIRGVRGYYRSADAAALDEETMRVRPGQFTYDGGSPTLAMAAAGVVCLHEFGQYDDWRIAKNMEVVEAAVAQLAPQPNSGQTPLDAYTLYYVGQALYQVGGGSWERCYPPVRDALVANQFAAEGQPADGHWTDATYLVGKPAQLYGTAVACFVLAIPNRYLPILEAGPTAGRREPLGPASP